MEDLGLIELDESFQCIQAKLVDKHSGNALHLDRAWLLYAPHECNLVRKSCRATLKGRRE